MTDLERAQALEAQLRNFQFDHTIDRRLTAIFLALEVARREGAAEMRERAALEAARNSYDGWMDVYAIRALSLTPEEPDADLCPAGPALGQ